MMVVGFAAAHAWHLAAYEAFPFHERVRSHVEGIHVEVQGRICNEPRPLGNYGYQAVFQLDSLRAAGATHRLPHRVLVRVLEREIAYGDVISLSGRLHLPEPPRNPGQFDYRRFLERHDWVGLLEVTRSEHFEILDSRPHPFKATALKARHRMAKAITRDLEGEHDICAILQAMVLGMRDEASPELEEPFRFSGTLHIFAVSGLHVGIFALIAWLTLKPFGLSRAQVTLLLIPLLFFYAFITGWRPSAVRAATMATVFLASFCVRREPRLLNSLGLAALLILAFNSNQLFLPGFELSFAVLLSIIMFTKALQRPFRLWLYPDPFLPTSLLEDHEQRAYAFRRWFGDIVSVSTAAWFGSLPLMAATFHLATPVAIFANCLLMPLGFCILLTAAMSMLCSLVGLLGPFNILFNNANFVLVNGLMALAEAFAQVPGGHFLVSGRLPFTQAPVEVTVLDLPHGGGCSHVTIRGGADELIDVGHLRSYQMLTEPYLRSVGLNSIDRLWLTHGDTGHTSAVPELMERYDPKVYQPRWRSRSPSVLALEQTLMGRGASSIRLNAGQSIALERSDYWEVLYPPADEQFAASSADDRGLVLRLHGQGWRVLFMADAGFTTERWLLESGMDLTADVLIKGHHADDVSGMMEFLDAVQPRVVVHDSEVEHQEMASHWATARGIPLIDQKEVGAVMLKLSKGKIRLEGFREGQPIFLKRAR
jgi:ComEC/Rec2-related protein